MTRLSRRGPCLLCRFAAMGLSALLTGCAAKDPPETAGSVDVERYMGLWYEIAKFPVFFERGLVGVTAEYSLREDGRIRVRNRGFKKSFDGKESSIEGYATVPDPKIPAKLRVRFNPFPARLFAADYWIIEVDEDYAHAVVSGPSREVLWILSRTPSMDEARYDKIVQRLAQKGFNVERLERMPQPSGQPEHE